MNCFRGQWCLNSCELCNGFEVTYTNAAWINCPAVWHPARSHSSEVVRDLLDLGADVNQLSWGEDVDAKHFEEQMARIMGPGISAAEESKLVQMMTEGSTAFLQASACLGDMDMARLLLDYNADPSLRSKSGHNAVQFALREGMDALVPLLRLFEEKELDIDDDELAMLEAEQDKARAAFKSFLTAVQKLEGTVGACSRQEVVHKDQPCIQRIADAFRAWVATPFWKDTVPKNSKAEDQPNLMSRLELYTGLHVDVRVHLFQDPSETYVHNHRMNFWSCCLAGRYEHSLVQADTEDAKDTHYAWNRTEDESLGGPPDERPGRLRTALGHTHQAGLNYFIADCASHQVTPYQQLFQRLPDVVTLFIRGTEKPRDTIVRSKAKEPDWQGLNGKEIHIVSCLCIYIYIYIERERELLYKNVWHYSVYVYYVCVYIHI